MCVEIVCLKKNLSLTFFSFLSWASSVARNCNISLTVLLLLEHGREVMVNALDIFYNERIYQSMDAQG